MPEPKEFSREVFLQSYQLIDLQRMSDDDMRKRRWSGLVEFALKHRRTKNLSYFVRIALPWLDQNAIDNGYEFGKIVLKYVVDAIDTKYDAELFIQNIEEYLSSTLRGDAMTLAEQFEARGYEKGRRDTMTLAEQFEAKGYEKGRRDTMSLGEKNLLIRQLTRKFGELSDTYQERVRHADAETLLVLGERLLDAKSIDEMFA